MGKTGFDFSGYATKSGLKCSDGRTILKDAFKHQDGQTVPLVWQHFHSEPKNILGHAILENRADGVYCRGKFNDTESGKEAKELVAHGDIVSLSIYANQLQEQGKNVIHGSIREVSLVLSGANPGALIDNVSIAHGEDSWEDDPTEAIIFSGAELSHEDNPEEENNNEDPLDGFTDDQKEVIHSMITRAVESAKIKEPAKSDPENKEVEHAEDSTTAQDVFDTFTDDQKKVVYYLIQSALEGAGIDAAHTNINEEGETIMKHNVFDQSNPEAAGKTLSHDQLTAIVVDAKRYGSLKDSFLAHAKEYGFDPIDILFPDAKTVGGLQVIKRKDDWVAGVLSETTHTPFSRIRTNMVDITAEEARARGYVTGNLKKEEVVLLTKRTTTPTTIYKKQKLDRDDMVDITDMDVVLWLKGEMRGMLDEEIARAILISDGRSAADEDKINEQNVRPIAFDDPNVFVTRVQVASDITTLALIDKIVESRASYRGTGTPTLYTTTAVLTKMLLLKDKQDRRIYNSVQELASALLVGKIVEVEVMTGAKRVSGDDEFPILGIIVNLRDYTIGADKGGEVNLFDDFDIDYNQFKYLIETRISGALTKPKSAIVIEELPAVVG